jgi:hypothetical protein
MAGVPGPGGDQFNWDHYTAAASNPVQDDALASIHQWYRQYLGRDASDAEAQSWANNPNGIGTVEQAIANSPEAKARAPQGAAGGGSGANWDQNWFSTNIGTPKTPQELVALEDKITAAGGKVLRNASGVAGKIQTPDGRIVDVINAAGAGGNGFQWLTGDGGSGGGAGGGAAGMGYGALLAPWTQNFTAPTADQALQSPGLQFALDEANRIGQNSAAAHGTLLNGRVQQALQGSNVQNALQGYGDVYNRALGEYGIQRQNFYDNQDRPYSKLSGLAGMGETAANQTGGYGSSYATGGSGALYGAGNTGAAGSVAQGNVWGPYVNSLATLGRTAGQ